MGRGSSSSRHGGGMMAQQNAANTPSGVSYDQFMKMSEGQRVAVINRILGDNTIQTPDYLDDSDTSKVIYALGMTGKPKVVSDSQLDTMPGRDVYRTVYQTGSMPPPTSDAILDQIRNGDYTQMSGKGGSAHGRAIYFATNFYDSATYGHGEKNPLVMRAKINPNAKIVSEQNLRSQMQQKGINFSTSSSHDSYALYALSQGIDGWYSGSYTMLVNRGCLTASSQNKSIKAGRSNATDWKSANNK